MNDAVPLILEELNLLERELSVFKSNDLLVQFNPQESIPFEDGILELNGALNKLIKQAKAKEYHQGYASLSVAEGWIRAKDDYCTPLFIYAVQPQINGVQNTVQWKVSEDEWLLNPWVANLLASSQITEITEKEIILNQLKTLGYEVNEHERYIGFFHPFRYSILREAVELKAKDDLQELDYFLDGSQRSPSINTEEIIPLLFPSDQSQYEAVLAAERNSLVIQGPPGTGKSQVLSNILGLLLQNDQRTVVMSTKKEALEVLQDRLKNRGLEDLVYIRNGENSAKNLLLSLQRSWELLERTSIEIGALNAMQEIQQFDNDLKRYHEKGLIGNLSPKEFLFETGYNPLERFMFEPGLPSYSDWKRDRELLDKIPREVLDYLRHLAPGLKLQADYESLMLQMQQTRDDIMALGLSACTIEEISTQHKLCQSAHLFSGANYLKFKPLLKRKNGIFKLKKEYELIRLKKTHSKESLAAWKKIPTEVELHALLALWESTSLWKKRSIRRQQENWLRVKEVDWRALAQATLQYHSLTKAENILQEKLLALGFEQPESDFAAFSTFSELEKSPLFHVFQSLTPEQVLRYRDDYFRINRTLVSLNKYFHVLERINVLHVIDGLLVPTTPYTSWLHVWDSLSQGTKLALKRWSNPELVANKVIRTEWGRFIAQYPSMKSFFEQGESHLDFLAEQNEKDCFILSNNLLAKRKVRFNQFHELLACPNKRLTEEELCRKVRLKEGKKQLVKWFARKRGFPTVREVLSSGAAEWIEVIKPLWFTSPLLLSYDFELKRKIFDVALIDEASQMPLAHCLGALYRSERIVVAGDLMQMAPSAYFTGGASERMSLLEHAAYHLPTFRLSYHYRSKHPDLIEFSNAHFYSNELIVAPCYPPYKAIEDHLLNHGIYREGVNEQELMTCLAILKNRISSTQGRIGIVTFSDRQMEALVRIIRNDNNPLIWESLDQGRLFLKTLEQVQGDECDELILTLGFGKNLENKLDLRLGPLTHQGGEKRLNVLLTRAKQKIHVIRSITSQDFGIVQSEGINVLKRWLIWLENLGSDRKILQQPHPEAVFEYSRGIVNTVRIADLQSRYLNLQTYRSLLKNRGWYLKEQDFSAERDHPRILPLDDNERFA